MEWSSIWLFVWIANIKKLTGLCLHLEIFLAKLEVLTQFFEWLLLFSSAYLLQRFIMHPLFPISTVSLKEKITLICRYCKFESTLCYFVILLKNNLGPVSSRVARRGRKVTWSAYRRFTENREDTNTYDAKIK